MSRKKYVHTDHTSQVFFDNGDAVQEANYCAADLTNLAGMLNAAPSEELKQLAVITSQKIYRSAFDAFIYGVEYGRKFPAGSYGSREED